MTSSVSGGVLGLLNSVSEKDSEGAGYNNLQHLAELDFLHKKRADRAANGRNSGPQCF